MTTRDVMAAARLPRHESERLFMKVTGKTRAEVVAGVPLDDETAQAYSVLCRRRLTGEPLQYIEGAIPFGSAEISVDERALIPRPETEYLWELAATLPQTAPAAILDLCTGSGALAIALSQVYPEATVLAGDISGAALTLAAENAVANQTPVEFFAGDLFGAIPNRWRGSIDLLVSNPPYVSSDELDELPDEVAGWEPMLALAAGADGLDVIRPLLAALPEWLAPGGWFLIEVASSHAEQALRILPDGLQAEVRLDLTGRPRYLVGRRR